MKVLRVAYLVLVLPTTIALLSPLTFAQDFRYISDVMHVPLRSGQGNEYRIINAALRSGTRLELLEVSSDLSWSRVRTPREIEGWIPSQYIMTERPAKLRLDEALEKLSVSEKNLKILSDENSQLKENNSTLQNAFNQQNETSENLSTELQQIKKLSSTAITLDEDYRALLEKHQMIQTERDTLVAENEQLKGDQRFDYMLYGAGILIFGIIIALVLPGLLPKKGYSDWA